MAEERIDFKLQADDSQLNSAMEAFISTLEKASQKSTEFSDVGTKAFDNLADAIKEQDDVLKDTIDTANDYNNQARRSASISKQVAEGIKEAASEYEFMGVNLGDVIGKLSAKQKALTSSVKAVSGLTKAFRILKVAIISTGIGALVVALGSLIAFLARTEKGMDIVNQAIAAVSSTVNVVVGRLATFGQAIASLIKGDVKGFFNGAKESVNGFGKELLTAAGNAIQLQKSIQQLRDDQRVFRAQTIEDIKEIQRLKNVLNDVNSTYGERKKALKELDAIQSDQERQTLEFERRERDNLRAQQEALGGLFKDKDKLQDQDEKYEKLKAEFSENELARQNELQGLIDEQRQKIKDLRDDYLDFIADIRDDARQAQIESIENPVLRLVAQRDLAEEQLRARIEEGRQKALLAGLELPPDFDEKVEDLFNEINRKFAVQIQKAQAEGLGLDALQNGENPLITSITGNNFEDRLAQAGKDGIEAYVEGMEDALKDNSTIFDKVQDFFLKLFNVDEAELRQIAESSLQIAGNLVDSLDNFNQAQITGQEKVIQTLDAQIAKTESALQEEIEKRQAGFANDAALLEQTLEQQQAAREEAEAKRLELERKSANQRLAINSIEQASNYVLAATKLTAAEAGKGVIGLFTALAGLSLLLKIVSSARAQSAQFQEVPKFRKGTAFIEGYGSGTSDSIVARVSRGERVVDAESNKRIGGRSLSNKDLVENHEFAEGVRKLMDKTMKNSRSIREQMKGYGSNGVINQLTSEVIRTERQLQQVNAQSNMSAMRDAYLTAAREANKDLIKYWETRPIEKVGSGGEIVKEWKEGGKIRRQKIKKRADNPRQ